jgi:hypothetical protein
VDSLPAGAFARRSRLYEVSRRPDRAFLRRSVAFRQSLNLPALGANSNSCNDSIGKLAAQDMFDLLNNKVDGLPVFKGLDPFANPWSDGENMINGHFTAINENLTFHISKIR